MRSTTIQGIYKNVVEPLEQKWLDYVRKTGKTHPDLRNFGNRVVTLMTEDGSYFRYTHAFAVEYDDGQEKWFLVFPEHSDSVVFNVEDLVWIDQYDQRIEIAKLKKGKIKP